MFRRHPLTRRSGVSRVRPSLGLEQLENRTTPSATSLLHVADPLLGTLGLQSPAPLQSAPSAPSAAPALREVSTAPVTLNLIVVRIDVPNNLLSSANNSAPVLITILREVPATAPIPDVTTAALSNLFNAIERALAAATESPLLAPTLGRVGNPTGGAGQVGRPTIDMNFLPVLQPLTSIVVPNATTGTAPGQDRPAQDFVGVASRGFLTFPNGTFFVESVIAAADLGFAPALLVPPNTIPQDAGPEVAPPDAGPRYGPEAIEVVPDEAIPAVDAVVPDVPVQAAAFVPQQLVETLRADPFGLLTVLSAAVGAWYHGSRRAERKPGLRPTEGFDTNA